MKINKPSFKEKKLEEMYKLMEETDGSEVQFYAILVKKNKEKEKIWVVNTLSITKSLGDEIIESAMESLIKKSQVRIKDFDLQSDLSPEYLIGKLADDQVPVLNKIISEMKKSDNSSISYVKLSKSTQLIGFAIEIGKKLTIFNKVTKTKLLNSKKYLYLVESPTGEVTHLEEKNLLSIPNSIDAILYEDPLYILEVNNFLSLFDYGAAFTKFIDSAKTSLASIVDDVQYVIDETGIPVHQTYNSIRNAHSLGLVKSRIDNTRYPHRNLVSLTGKGEKVAAKVEEIVVILNEGKQL